MNDITSDLGPEYDPKVLYRSMGFLMDYTAREFPEYLEVLSTGELIDSLKTNLFEAGDKLLQLALQRHDGLGPDSELVFIGKALHNISRGEAVEANPHVQP